VEYQSSYERFLAKPAKSFFKELFLGSAKIAYRLKVMSERNGVLKGLKDQECEKGNLAKRPPIAYVPVVDEVQDTLNSNLPGKRYEKLTAPNGTTFNVSVWYSGTPEQFLNHVKQGLNAVKRTGLMDKYNTARAKRVKAKKDLKKVEAEIAEYEEKMVENPPADAKLVLEELKMIREGHLTTRDEGEAERVTAAEGIFSQYANLLSVEQRGAWEKIVEQKVEVSDWTDLRGRKRSAMQGKTYKHFLTCTVFHLLTIFDEDAAERQQLYISNTLKKPQRVTVRAFFVRVEQLNSYIKYLPSLYNSPKAVESTVLAEPFTDAQLAVLLLRMCPLSWQNQYNLNQNTIPQDTRQLLAVLENIEQLSTNSAVPKPPSNNNNGGNAKSNGNSEKHGKRKGTNSSGDRIPKKQRVEKHCTLCQKHGGAASTHNTSECTKYEKDGTLKTEWTKKSPVRTKTLGGKSFAQALERLRKLEKAVEKKSSSKKKRYRSDSSSSDSE